MAQPINDLAWVWVVIEREKSEETLYGQIDEEKGESFIPVFNSKEDALMVLGRLNRRKDHYYQVQAMRYGEVARAALDSGFRIFFVGGEGEILERVILTH